MGGGEVRKMKWGTQRQPFSYSSFFPLPPAASSLSFYSILTITAPYNKLEGHCVEMSAPTLCSPVLSAFYLLVVL